MDLLRPHPPPPHPIPLTQVSHPGEARVKADLLDFVGASQEEINDAVGHHAVGESLDNVVEAPPHVETVPVVPPRLDGDGLPVGGGVTCDLPDGPSHLGRGEGACTSGNIQKADIQIKSPLGCGSPGPEWCSPRRPPVSPAWCRP